MATVHFTAHLRKVAPSGGTKVAAGTLGSALEEVFANSPRLKAYVVDEQNRLRRHVVLFLNGERLTPGDWPGRVVAEGDEIYVMQALSGG